jgi:hypothetical protein
VRNTLTKRPERSVAMARSSRAPSMSAICASALRGRGAAREAERREDLSRRGVERFDARADVRVEVGAARGGVVGGEGGEKKGISAGGRDDRVALRFAEVGRDSVEQRARANVVERRERDSVSCRRALSGRREDRVDHRRARARANGEEHEDRGRIGGPQRFGDERAAVDVAPVRVVDPQDRGRAVGQGLERPSKRDEPELSRFCAADRRLVVRAPRDPRKQQPELCRNALVQRRQLVHDGVDRLELDPLIGAASSRENDGAAGARLVGEGANERGFSHARRSFDHAEQRRAADLRRVEHGVQMRALFVAPHALEALRWDLDRASLSHDAEHGVDRRSLVRPRREQRVAQRREVFGRVCTQRAHRRRPLLLGGEHERRRSREGQLSRQRFVEQHAERVGVGRRAQRAARGLLGGHVEGRSEQDDLVGRGEHLGARLIAGEPEVREHRAAVAGDEDVRRFDVEVELSGSVKKREPAGDLRERDAQLLDVGPRPKGGRVDRRFDARRDKLRHSADRLGDLRDGLRARDRPRPRRYDHLELLFERRPVDELHREEPVAALAVQLIELDEVRVSQLGQRPKLTLQPQDVLVRMHGLERDASVAQLVERLEDAAEAPLSERSFDAEPPAQNRFRPRRIMARDPPTLSHDFENHSPSEPGDNAPNALAADVL